MKSLFIFIISVLCIAPFAGEYAIETTVGLMLAGSLAYKYAPGGSLFTIPIQDAQGVFTKGLISVYKERTTAMSFLRSFFKPVESMTKEISIAVRRGTEKVATDVVRYSDGNRNTFDKSSEKIFVPPLYYEYLTANDHRLYDQVITAISTGNTTYFAEMTAELADDLMELQDKIERAIELQCAQILQTGIISLNSTTDIDFKRKAASLVAYNAANDFAINTVDPSKVIEQGCIFIRQKGKSQGGTFNAILGSDALNALLNNTIIKERGDVRSFDLMNIREPQRNAVGATLHGQLTCGSYKVNLWTYPEYYDNASGVSTPYIDGKKVIVMPEAPEFKLAYAAVPQLIKNGTVPQKGAYLIQEFMDEEKTAHKISIKSAPVAIPVAIDQLYTVTVLS